jgi:hypothetical protein
LAGVGVHEMAFFEKKRIILNQINCKKNKNEQ